MKSRTIIFILITILIFLGMSYFGLKIFIEKSEQLAKQKAQEENILEGIQLEPNIITIDYSRKIADGSPLVFGGVQFPDSEDAWNKVAESGITFLRTDLFFEYSLPDTNIEAYKHNINNIQDPGNWNRKFIENRSNIFKEAKKRNIKTLAIISYAPKWLTYSGTEHGIPKDWNVYEDIVKKLYKINRDNIDYVEIWNEPTHDYFLDVKNSPYQKAEAYKLIFEHGAKAIREVDNEINDGKKTPIGAQISHDPEKMQILDELVNDSSLSNYIDYISYHNYVYTEPSDINLKSVIKNTYLERIPIMLDEWNYDSKEKEDSPYKTSNKSIIFTSNKLLSYLQMGLLAANYYSLFPLERSNETLGHGYLAYYENTTKGPQLLPQARSWRILSKSLGLGKDKSKIVQTTERSDINSLGFVNSENIPGGAFVNNTDESQLLELNMRNLPITKRVKLNIYIASPDQDGGHIIDTRTIYPENNEYNFRYLLPKESVLGIKIYEEKQWYDFFDPIIQ